MTQTISKFIYYRNHFIFVDEGVPRSFISSMNQRWARKQDADTRHQRQQRRSPKTEKGEEREEKEEWTRTISHSSSICQRMLWRIAFCKNYIFIFVSPPTLEFTLANWLYHEIISCTRCIHSRINCDEYWRYEYFDKNFLFTISLVGPKCLNSRKNSSIADMNALDELE